MAEQVKLKHRLALRLARYTLVLAFLIGLLLSSLQVFGDYQNQESSIDETIQQILVVSGPPATRAVNTLDTTLAEEVVNGLLQYPFIISAQIKDELGKTLALSNSKLGPSKTRWITQKISSANKTYEMKLQTPDYVGVGPGFLVLQVSKDAALKPFFDRSMIVIISGVARNVLLALMLMVLFYLALTQPLERLTGQFIKVKDEPEKGRKLDVAESHKHNELGLLCDAGNQFMETVQQLLSDKDQSAKDLKKSELRLLKLIDRIPQMVVAQNEAGDILFANQQFANFYGQSIKTIRDFKLMDVTMAALEMTHLDAIRVKTLQSKAVTFINDLALTNHKLKKQSFSVQVAPFEYFTEAATLMVANDISGQIKVQAHIAHLASHDSLTGLPNRMLLNDRINLALANSRRSNEYHAVLFLDLDHFKNINDSQGHSIGDEVLKKVADGLSETMRQSDTVARLGGDEFVILIQGLSNDKQLASNYVSKVCDKIIKLLSNPIVVDGRTLHVGVSIGIVLFPIEDESKDDLLRYADTAMYRAKAQGRNQAVFYHQDMSQMVEQRHELENELHVALNQGQFEMYYQPQVDEQGKVYGFEALIRWHHPQKGLVPPDQFIPILESGGLILPISDWIIKHCCRQVQIWRDSGFWQPQWHVAINVSPLQFYQDNFIELLKQAIEESKIEYSHVCVEITETVAVENLDFAAKRLDEIRALGISVALDDFGTGYSSMSYLKNLPIDVLKIDRCFIKDLGTNEKDRLVMRAITGVANVMELIVVAEGVETQEQVELASELGCQYFQGYHFNRPVPADELAEVYAHEVE